MGAQYITQPISYAALDEMLTENTGVIFDMLPIHEHAFFVNQPLEALELREERLMLFGILRKESSPTFLFNPKSDFVLQPHDMLIIMGRKHHINALRKLNDKGNIR